MTPGDSREKAWFAAVRVNRLLHSSITWRIRRRSSASMIGALTNDREFINLWHTACGWTAHLKWRLRTKRR